LWAAFWERHDDSFGKVPFTVTMVDVRLGERLAGSTNCYICNNKEGLHRSATVSLPRLSIVSEVRSPRGRLEENRAALPVARSAIPASRSRLSNGNHRPDGIPPRWSSPDTNVKLPRFVSIVDPCARETLAI
jgi:hypothetical protein